MLPVSWIVYALSVAVVFGAPQTGKDNWSRPAKNVWAVLIAGSHKWVRYRHQSNVCHAYKLLRENGIPENRIITFLYDDIAYNENNPEPGVIRNEPGGENVYKDVPIDYKGDNVNKDVYLNVLQGFSTKLQGTGSGRVVASTKNENIFIFHTGLGGHGGIITFPDSKNTTIRAPALAKTFERMYDQKTYKNLLMVLESSHSGAMFENNTLRNDIKVLAMTAGGPDEDTWGTWCETKLPCLAGLFAYAWLNNTKNASPDTSLFNYYDIVRNSVANTGKEHPQMYGDWKVGKLPLSDFIGHTAANSLRSSSIKNLEQQQNVDLLDTRHDDKFDKDLMLSDDETIVNENEKRNLQTIIQKIIQLVIPEEHNRNLIINNSEPAVGEFTQNKCFVDLLLLFYEKCTSQDTNSEARQEDTDLLKYLCDTEVVNIQQMSAVEAIKKTCV